MRRNVQCNARTRSARRRVVKEERGTGESNGTVEMVLKPKYMSRTDKLAIVCRFTCTSSVSHTELSLVNTIPEFFGIPHLSLRGIDWLRHLPGQVIPSRKEVKLGVNFRSYSEKIACLFLVN